MLRVLILFLLMQISPNSILRRKMICITIFPFNLLVLVLSTLIVIHRLGLGSLILLLTLCIPPLIPLTSLLLVNASLRIPVSSLCPMITKEKRFLLQVGAFCFLVRTISLFCFHSEAVMACQPYRTKFPFFVCNENVIQFFILSRTSVGFALDEFTPLKWLSDGRDYLYRLITASDTQLFCTLPQVLVDNTLVPLTGFLGAGAHETVQDIKGKWGAPLTFCAGTKYFEDTITVLELQL